MVRAQAEACTTTEWGNLTMKVLNLILAVAGWVWTGLVILFALFYHVGYKAAVREKSQASP